MVNRVFLIGNLARDAESRYPATNRYRGIDLDGREISRSAKGFHARVVQHEVDHLDGILYPQRMKDLTKFIFESEARHWARQNT